MNILYSITLDCAIYKIQNVDKKFPASTRDCWTISKYQLQNSGEIAKQEGKYKGRKPIEVDNLSLICEKWINGEITGTQAAELMSVCRTTAYKKLKQYKEQKDDENSSLEAKTA